MSNKVGRPSKYKEEYCDFVDEYLKTTGGQNMNLPMVEGLAIELAVNKTTLYEWAKKHKKFSNAIRKIKAFQKKQLVNDGIYGGKEINASIIKLLLQSNHGMRERQDITSKDEKMDGLVIIKNGDKA